MCIDKSMHVIYGEGRGGKVQVKEGPIDQIFFLVDKTRQMAWDLLPTARQGKQEVRIKGGGLRTP